MADKEDLQHLFFDCCYAGKCWQWLFALFNLCWVFGNVFHENVLQILVEPKLKSDPKLIWNNVVKALLAEIWFERNKRVFHDKSTPWLDRFEIARLNASSWYTLSNSFADFSIQDLSLNWKPFIFPAYLLLLYCSFCIVFLWIGVYFVVVCTMCFVPNVTGG